MAAGQKLTVRSGSANLAVTRYGAGPAIVMLHAGVADQRVYDAQIDVLSARNTVVTYDRRGFGETVVDDLDEPFLHRDDLAAVIGTMDLAPSVLIGGSQGGRIAIDFALTAPEAVAALVLIGSALSGVPESEPPASVAADIERLDALEEAGDWGTVNAIEARLWLDGPLAPEFRVTGPLRDLFLDMNGKALMSPDLTGLRQPPSAFERLEEIAVPTLLIDGDLDFPAIRARHRLMADRLANAEAFTIPGTAHLPNMEQPQRFNALVTGFLGRT